MVDLINLFESMLRIRMVEETIAEKYSEQEMRCPTHFCLGQEAIPVGVSIHLRKLTTFIVVTEAMVIILLKVVALRQ